MGGGEKGKERILLTALTIFSSQAGLSPGLGDSQRAELELRSSYRGVWKSREKASEAV